MGVTLAPETEMLNVLPPVHKHTILGSNRSPGPVSAATAMAATPRRLVRQADRPRIDRMNTSSTSLLGGPPGPRQAIPTTLRGPAPTQI